MFDPIEGLVEESDRRRRLAEDIEDDDHEAISSDHNE